MKSDSWWVRIEKPYCGTEAFVAALPTSERSEVQGGGWGTWMRAVGGKG